MKRQRWLLAVLAGATLLAGSIAAVALSYFGGDEDREPTDYQDWPDVFSKHLDEVIAPNGEYRLVTEVYQRHGAVGSPTHPNDRYLPERFALTTWHQFDPTGQLAGFGSELTGVGGRTLSKSSLVHGGEVLTVDVERGTQDVSAWLGPRDVASLKEAQLRSLQSLLARVTSGEPETILKEDSGRATITFAVQAPTSVNEPDGFSIPYVDDLKPVSAYRAVELDETTRAMVAQRVYVVDDSGVETLVESIIVQSENGVLVGD